jgi:uncharacterized protein YdeI (BOF family)
MTETGVRRMHGERGASLILAIAFMVVIGGISAAVLATTSSGLQDRVALDQARNREYDADSAIETTIAQARQLSGSCPAPPPRPFNLNNANVGIHVDCSTALVPGPNGLLLSRGDLLFVACVAMGSGDGTTCTPGTDPPIINAQVNFQGTAPTVTTFVQAWSVNG